MRITFIFFIFIFLNHSVLQGQVVISPTHNITTKKIDKKIDVVSNIPNATTLGYVPSNIQNDRKFIKPSNEINAWLQSFVYQQFDTSKDAKAKKLLWVIQDLSIGKDSTQKDAYSFVKLKADIYDNTKQNDANYQLVNTFDTIWIVRNTNTDFAQMIETALDELYKNSTDLKKTLANKRFQQITQKFTDTKEEIIKNVKLQNNHQILKDSVYPAGIYLSFDQFKKNSPAIKDFYARVDSQTNKVKLYQILPDSSTKLIENAWGISLNNELYFYTLGQLYPIEKSGNTFYMAKYLEPRTRRNQAIYWRMYVGKWQGDINPYNDAHVLRKSADAEKQILIEATHLDFDLQDFIY